MSLRELAESTNVSRDPVRRAALVLEHARDLAELVLKGAQSLNEAYSKALERKAEAESEEGKMARLLKGASDLADLVAEDKMKLAEGLAAMKAREDEKRKEEEARRQEKVLGTQQFISALRLLNPAPSDAQNQAEYILEIYEPSITNIKITKELLTECAIVLIALAHKWKVEK
jgi:hypothetical protein